MILLERRGITGGALLAGAAVVCWWTVADWAHLKDTPAVATIEGAHSYAAAAVGQSRSMELDVREDEAARSAGLTMLRSALDKGDNADSIAEENPPLPLPRPEVTAPVPVPSNNAVLPAAGRGSSEQTKWRPHPHRIAAKGPAPQKSPKAAVGHYLEQIVEQGDAGEVKYRYQRQRCTPQHMVDVCYMPPENRRNIVVQGW